MIEKKNIVVALAGVMIACISIIGVFNMNGMEDIKKPNNDHHDDFNKEESGDINLENTIYNVGYVDHMFSRSIIISNRKDLEEYMDNFMKKEEVLTKYNEEYFKDGSLALIYETTSNSAISIKVNSLEIVNDTLKINYSRESSSEVGATVMGGSLIVVEVPKSVTTIN